MNYNIKIYNKNNNLSITNDFNEFFLNQNYIILYKKNKFVNKNYMFFDSFFLVNCTKYIRSLIYIYCSFCYAKVFLKVGLGFRKKFSSSNDLFSMNISKRRWVIFKPFPTSFFFNIKRRNLYIFSNTKRKLFSILIHFKYMRRETIYKVKGIMSLIRIKFNKRISRSMLFARRVKFRRMKLKLTKKQKQKK